NVVDFPPRHVAVNQHLSWMPVVFQPSGRMMTVAQHLWLLHRRQAMKTTAAAMSISLAILATVGGGCAARQQQQQQRHHSSSAHIGHDGEEASAAVSALVMPTPELRELAAHRGRSGYPQAVHDPHQWEFSRNDRQMGRSPYAVADWQYLEVRHREHLRTINGKPREYSTTSRRSIERRIVR